MFQPFSPLNWNGEAVNEVQTVLGRADLLYSLLCHCITILQRTQMNHMHVC